MSPSSAGPRRSAFYKSKREPLAESVEKLSARQSLRFAHDRYALLLSFQAMDVAGNDGAIACR